MTKKKQALNVAIIGAGLVGLSTALCLRSFGIRATVYERANQPRADGTGIMVWSEGMQVLASLVGADKVKQACNAVHNVTTCTATNEVVNKLDMSQLKPFDAPIGLFHRSELYKLLLDELGQDNIQCNSPCELIDNALCIDGRPLEADVIIGADGAFSKVREFVAPDAQVRTSKVVCCRGIIDYSTPIVNDDNCYVFAGMHSRIVTYTYNTAQQSKYWFAACTLGNDDVRAEDRADFTLNKSLIFDKFGYYNKDLLNMIEATPDDSIMASRLVDLEPFEQWTRQNAVLVGDSCCAVLPSLGIGYSLGLQNGYVLAQSIAANSDSISNAFSRYKVLTQPRSHELQDINNRISALSYLEAFDPVEVAELYGRFAATNM